MTHLAHSYVGFLQILLELTTELKMWAFAENYLLDGVLFFLGFLLTEYICGRSIASLSGNVGWADGQKSILSKFKISLTKQGRSRRAGHRPKGRLSHTWQFMS